MPQPARTVRRSSRSLERCEAAGYHNPALDFEAGWCLLESGRWNGAIDRLTHYALANPERAQTHLFSHGHTSRWTSRTRRPPSWTRPPATLIWPSAFRTIVRSWNTGAATKQSRADLRLASMTLGDLVFQPIDTLAGDVTRERLGIGLDTDRRILEGKRPWWLDLTLAAGFNADARMYDPTNVVPFANETAPVFARGAVDAGYALLSHRQDELDVGYQGIGDAYAVKPSKTDSVDNLIYSLDVREITDQLWGLGEAVSLSGQISYDHSSIGKTGYRDQFGLEGGAKWQINSIVSTDFIYYYLHSNYEHGPLPDPIQPALMLLQNDNNDAQTFSADVRLTGPQTYLAARLGPSTSGATPRARNITITAMGSSSASSFLCPGTLPHRGSIRMNWTGMTIRGAIPRHQGLTDTTC